MRSHLVAVLGILSLCLIWGAAPGFTQPSLLSIGAAVGFYQIDTADDQFALLSMPRVSVSFFKNFDAELSFEYRNKGIHYTEDRNVRLTELWPVYLQLNYAFLPDQTFNPFVQLGFNFHNLEVEFENSKGSDSATAVGYHAGLGLRYMLDSSFIDVMLRYEALSDTESFSVYNDQRDELKTADWDGENWALMMGIRTFVL